MISLNMSSLRDHFFKPTIYITWSIKFCCSDQIIYVQLARVNNVMYAHSPDVFIGYLFSIYNARSAAADLVTINYSRA